MKEDIIVVKIEFFDHALGGKKVIYGEVRAIKIDRFETNEDSWITLTGVDIPKIDVLRISEYKEGEVRYAKCEEKEIVNKNAKSLVGISSS